MNKVKNGDKEGWTVFMDTDKVKLFYQQEEGSPLITVYTERKLDAPIFNTVSIATELQEYKNWVPLCYKSAVHNQKGLRMDVECDMSIPWPFRNRNSYLSATFMEMENEEAIMLLLKTREGSKWSNGDDIPKDDY